MKQLTGLDGSFLYMETPTSFGHVNGLAIYERPTATSIRTRPSTGATRRRSASSSRCAGASSRCRWASTTRTGSMDPNFDLDFHIRHMSLAPPGRRDQLAEQVARIVGRPMDRTRPLWEVYVIEGLEDGSWALLTKYHHATIDGASGVIMMTMMNDLTPDAPPPGESPPWEPEEIPSDAELLRLAIGNLVRNPAKAMRAAAAHRARRRRRRPASPGVSSAAQQAGAAIKALARTVRRAAGVAAAVGGPADAVEQEHHRPPPLRHARRQGRATSSGSKAVTGGTLNDVVMAIVAGALRAYLLRARRPAGPAAAGDGAGVDPHRQRGGAVDEPGLRPRRRPADAPRRSARAPRPRAGRRWTAPSGSSSSCRPRRSSTSSSTRRRSSPPRRSAWPPGSSWPTGWRRPST